MLATIAIIIVVVIVVAIGLDMIINGARRF